MHNFQCQSFSLFLRLAIVQNAAGLRLHGFNDCNFLGKQFLVRPVELLAEGLYRLPISDVLIACLPDRLNGLRFGDRRGGRHPYV